MAQTPLMYCFWRLLSMQSSLMILISCICAIRGVLFEFKGCMLAKIKYFSLY
jgi:hypothetical protein